MNFKKIVLILCITIITCIVILFGTSYAWYAYNNAQSRLSGKTTKEVPTIIFSQTEYVNSRNIMPIDDNDKYNYANKNSFTITIGENLKNYETAVEISLKDIEISNELKIVNYKYELLQNKEIVSSGNFSDIGTAKSLKIMPMTKLTPASFPQTYSYELYIWLSDDGSDQNHLMNKVFSARININSATKKVERG